MNYKKKTALFTFIALAAIIALPIVEGSFFVDSESINSSIARDEVATYNVTITNMDDTTRTYTVELAAVYARDWRINPGSVTVPADSSVSFVMSLRPSPTVESGSKSISVRISSGRGTTEELSVPVRVLSEGQFVGYPPNVRLAVSSAMSHDPREIYDLDVGISNRNPRDLEDLELSISSDHFGAEQIFDLEGLEEEEFNFELEMDDRIPPGEYPYVVRLHYPGAEGYIAEEIRSLEILGYSYIEPIINTTSNWFKTTQTITMYNDGNEESVKEVSLRAPWYQRLFLSASEEYEVVTLDGGANIQFSQSVQAEEEIVITVDRNYRPLVILLLVAILATLAYFSFRSPVIAKKKVYQLKQSGEGVSEMKIRLYIKNRSNNPVTDVSVTDYLPRITEYESLSDPGSVSPDKVSRTAKKGTILSWNFETLESQEERILSYKIKSNLGIVGNITLPKIKLNFRNSKNIQRTSYSDEAVYK